MQILVVAGILAVMGLMYYPSEWLPWPVLAGGAVGYVLVAYAASRWNAWRGLRRLMSPGGSGEGDRVGALVGMATRIYLVAGISALMLAGWGVWINESLGLKHVPLVGAAFSAGPFVAALMAHWWANYPFERAMRMQLIAQMALAGEPVMPAWTRREYLSFQLRHQLLFIVVPAGTIIFILDSLRLLHGVMGSPVLIALAVVAMGTVFLLAPALIVRIWRTRPVPGGELLARLEGLCRRMKLRYRRVLVWDTGGVIVNAGVIGVVRPARYVLLSDALLGRFEAGAVDAIFAHEAGHVVHRHIPYMIAFTAGLLTLVGLASQWAFQAAGVSAADAHPLSLIVAVGVWGWLFGLLSRRFERQADVFAAAAVGSEGGEEITPEGVRTFGGALMAVGRYNGIAPTRRNFRHGSIARRVSYLSGLLASPRGRAGVDRAVGRIKLAIWALVAAAAGTATLYVITSYGISG